MPERATDEVSHPSLEDGLGHVSDDDASQPSEGGLHIRSGSDTSNEDANALPVPIWMRESSKAFKWKWVPLPLRKAGRATAEWVKGPKPPRVLRITPLFPAFQEAPIKLMDKYIPKKRHRMTLLIGTYFCWALIWSLMLRHAKSAGNIQGYGTPVSIWCGASFWYGWSAWTPLLSLTNVPQEQWEWLRSQWQ